MAYSSLNFKGVFFSLAFSVFRELGFSNYSIVGTDCFLERSRSTVGFFSFILPMLYADFATCSDLRPSCQECSTWGCIPYWMINYLVFLKAYIVWRGVSFFFSWASKQELDLETAAFEANCFGLGVITSTYRSQSGNSESFFTFSGSVLRSLL